MENDAIWSLQNYKNYLSILRLLGMTVGGLMALNVLNDSWNFLTMRRKMCCLACIKVTLK